MAKPPGAPEARAAGDARDIARALAVVAPAVAPYGRAVGEPLPLGPTRLTCRPPFRETMKRPARGRPAFGTFAGVPPPIPSGETGDTVAPAGATTRPCPAPPPEPLAALPRAASPICRAAPSVRAVLNPLVLSALRFPFRVVTDVTTLRLRPVPERKIELPRRLAVRPCPGTRR